MFFSNRFGVRIFTENIYEFLDVIIKQFDNSQELIFISLNKEVGGCTDHVYSFWKFFFEHDIDVYEQSLQKIVMSSYTSS